MKTICSSNMPFAAEAFGTLGETVVLDGRAISAADVRDAEILAIRSTTKVNAALLDDSRVRFVGTATIGTDHLDIPYLEGRGIRWCYSPGCNANSVSEYVTAALLCLSDRHGLTLEGRTLGVIGVGNVGSRVLGKARALGMRVLPNDPPREREEGADAAGLPAVARYYGLEQVLAEADILTLHVPLTREGADATHHMADDSFFARMKPGCVLLNAARGAVLDSNALLAALDRGVVAHAVLDTWEGEPNYRTDVLERVGLGTPHIAGHSYEGKYIGTLMVYREACDMLGLDAAWTPDALLPPPVVPRVTADAAHRTDESVLREVVRKVYDIEADDGRLRKTARHPDAERIRDFDGLRKSYPIRREFPFTEVTLKHASPALHAKVAGLGFRVTCSRSCPARTLRT